MTLAQALVSQGQLIFPGDGSLGFAQQDNLACEVRRHGLGWLLSMVRWALTTTTVLQGSHKLKMQSSRGGSAAALTCGLQGHGRHGVGCLLPTLGPAFQLGRAPILADALLVQEVLQGCCGCLGVVRLQGRQTSLSQECCLLGEQRDRCLQGSCGHLEVSRLHARQAFLKRTEGLLASSRHLGACSMTVTVGRVLSW